MNRDELEQAIRAKLDIDKSGKVDLQDAVAFATASVRNKLITVGVACFIVGVLIGKFML